ncbi:MAG: peptide-methionine (R)-S-oxide reductase MsrB [Hydrogenophilus sp.]|nr:peptide-methionine (R)-S-oxide reductase MsrB [Hydrogenophilus sp.]
MSHSSSIPSAPPSTLTLAFGMGCFWGAQKRLSAVVSLTEVGYAGGDYPNPTYEQVLAYESARQRGQVHGRNHAEVVLVTLSLPHSPPSCGPFSLPLPSPALIALLHPILAAFWEGHDPTQRDRQGDDIGSNYRSALYYPPEHGFWLLPLLLASRAAYGWALWQAAGGAPPFPAPCTEIAPLTCYTPAEPYHQNYLDRHPHGYCGAGGRGISFPAPLLCSSSSWSSPWPHPPAEARSFWTWLARPLLTPAAYAIAFEAATEPPYTSCLLTEERAGFYLDPLSGAPLFSSVAKYSSGTGWPSFTNPLPDALTDHLDTSHGMIRTEIRSRSSGIHLGHRFDDGPPPTGQRYCLNGEVLCFVPCPSPLP